MLNRGLLSLALPLYRTELILNSLNLSVSESLNQKLKEQVKESIKNSNLISKRYYLETFVNETINLEKKNETSIKEDSNEFENNDFELIVNKAV
jgi:hypothetical protein